MYSTSDFRKGLKIEMGGEPYLMVDFQHVKPGKGGAFVRTRLKSLVTGNVIDQTFRSGDKVDKPDLEEREMQFLYETGGEFHFMDTTSFDQLFLTVEQLGESKDYLKENLIIKALFHNKKPIGIEVPMFVELKVVQSEPGIRGDTASGANKPATLESGAVIQVPLFVAEGDLVRIDTRTREYITRVK
ncbi:MAG: elongation factor P [Deltaproteobacteria bacterium RBG_19FT_COMBO_52_11]|nr:MAG: elongation factor P [Deltaproteobacteria bacterium RBG_19FT_COMBO_52_11]